MYVYICTVCVYACVRVCVGVYISLYTLWYTLWGVNSVLNAGNFFFGQYNILQHCFKSFITYQQFESKHPLPCHFVSRGWGPLVIYLSQVPRVRLLVGSFVGSFCFRCLYCDASCFFIGFGYICSMFPLDNYFVFFSFLKTFKRNLRLLMNVLIRYYCKRIYLPGYQLYAYIIDETRSKREIS